MPLSKYFGGKGKKVMSEMKDRYGDKKGENVFHATANKNHQTPDDPKKKARKSLGQRIAEGMD